MRVLSQAAKSVKAITERPTAPPPSGIPTHCYAMLKVKEGADVAAMTAGLKAYSAASKKSAGKVTAS